MARLWAMCVSPRAHLLLFDIGLQRARQMSLMQPLAMLVNIKAQRQGTPQHGAERASHSSTLAHVRLPYRPLSSTLWRAGVQGLRVQDHGRAGQAGLPHEAGAEVPDTVLHGLQGHSLLLTGIYAVAL